MLQKFDVMFLTLFSPCLVHILLSWPTDSHSVQFQTAALILFSVLIFLFFHKHHYSETLLLLCKATEE